MSNGTSGDINIWDFEQTDNYPTANFKKSEFIGNDIAEKVFKSLSALQWETSPKLEVAYKDLTLQVRKPTKEEFISFRLIFIGVSPGKESIKLIFIFLSHHDFISKIIR